MSHLKNLPENKTIVSHTTDMGGRNEAKDEGEAIMNVRTALWGHCYTLCKTIDR